MPIGASATLTETEETQSITSALLEYSRHRPLEARAYVTATDAEEYALATWVSGWTPATYTVHQVLFGIGTDYERQLDSREYTVSTHSDGTQWVRFLPRMPAGYVLALVYWGPHSLTDSTETIPAADQAAVVQLAAAYVLQNAANKFSINAASSIQADSVTQSDQAKSYSFQSDDARKNFEEHIKGVKTCRSVRVGWNLDYHNGAGRLFNPGRGR